jgi:phosphatidylcholine synthase
MNMNKKAITAAQKYRFFAIHILTATGAGWAFMALIAAAEANWAAMFFWLGIALAVDAVDGPLARRTNIAERFPRWSGEILDLVVDFLTYVFVPAYAIVMCGLLPHGFALASGLAIVVTSALYFADGNMKTEDNHFSGFPAIWNIAAFYLLLLTPSPLVSALSVAALIVMTFLPIPFIHPVRVVQRRRLNLSLLAVWTVLAGVTMWHNMAPGPAVTGALCILGVYILGGGFLRGAKNRIAAAAAAR